MSDLGALVAYVYAEPLSDKPAASCAGLLADAQGGAQAPAFGIIDIGIYGEAFGFCVENGSAHRLGSKISDSVEQLIFNRPLLDQGPEHCQNDRSDKKPAYAISYMPPMTPTRMTGIGVDKPRAMITGLRMLSTRLAGII